MILTHTHTLLLQASLVFRVLVVSLANSSCDHGAGVLFGQGNQGVDKIDMSENVKIST